jgi:hypothetical protein
MKNIYKWNGNVVKVVFGYCNVKKEEYQKEIENYCKLLLKIE